MSPSSSLWHAKPKASAVRSVRRYANAVWLVPLGYALLGVLALAAPNYEILPFFSWFLFPVTPATVTRFAVSVQRDAVGASNAPSFERDLGLGEKRHSMDAQTLIQALGSAVERGDAADIHPIRRTFESNFLPPACRYVLLKQNYDPVDRWRSPNDEVSRGDIITTFECEAQ